MSRQTSPRQGGKAAKLSILLACYSFFRAFEPIESYIVPYLVREKHFSNFQVVNKVFPFSIYSTLFFTILAAPACDIFSYWSVVLAGNFAELITFAILRFGKSLLPMQIMQVIYGLSVSSTVVFSAYIFLHVTENEFQTLTSIMQASSLGASVLASELGQVLVSTNSHYTILLDITLLAVGISCIVSFFLPKDQLEKQRTRPLLLSLYSLQELWEVVRETWQAKNLQLLSLWWAFAYGGFSLVLNYGTNLFEGISSTSNYNGHVVAAGTAFGCIAAFLAIYLEKIAANTGGLLYIVGSLTVGILCLLLGNCKSIWIAYLFYVVIVGIKGLLLCLVYAQCGVLLPNRDYILLFSLNTVLGLIIETLFQIFIEMIGLNIFMEFMAFGVYFLGFTALLTLLGIIHYWRTGTIVLGPFSNRETALDVTMPSPSCARLVTECDLLISQTGSH